MTQPEARLNDLGRLRPSEIHALAKYLGEVGSSAFAKQVKIFLQKNYTDMLSPAQVEDIVLVASDVHAIAFSAEVDPKLLVSESVNERECAFALAMRGDSIQSILQSLLDRRASQLIGKHLKSKSRAPSKKRGVKNVFSSASEQEIHEFSRKADRTLAYSLGIVKI